MLCRRWSPRKVASVLAVPVVPVHWLENGEKSSAGAPGSGEKSQSSVDQALTGNQSLGA